MKTLFLIKTDTFIKGEQANRYWIETNIIEDFCTTAENEQEAFSNFCKSINDGYIARISKNAQKTKNAIYRDIDDKTLQVGYVITALTEIEDKKVYCDLWCRIFKIADFDNTTKIKG